MWNNGQGWQAYGDLNGRTWYQSDRALRLRSATERTENTSAVERSLTPRGMAFHRHRSRASGPSDKWQPSLFDTFWQLGFTRCSLTEWNVKAQRGPFGLQVPTFEAAPPSRYFRLNEDKSRKANAKPQNAKSLLAPIIFGLVIWALAS